MKFKKLTEDDILHAKEIYYSSNLAYDERISELMQFFGKGEKTTRNWLVKLGIKKTATEDSPQFKKAKKKKISKKSKRFIFTWAQNNTPVHEVFLRNIEAYAKEINAEVHIIAGRYKNPTSVFDDKDFESWHSRVEPYLFAARQNAHKRLIVCGDVKISPTATNPMTALEGFSGPESSIFGHPKMQMKMVSALEGTAPKMMMTTGAVTLENYTDSKAGKKGEFHHTLGFVVVEIKDEEVFYTRQVTATEDGNFNDLYYNVSFDGGYEEVDLIPGLTFQGEELIGKTVIKRNKSIDGAILGDIHFGETDKDVMNTTLNVLFKKLKPKEVVLHDVFDGHSISHHDRKDAFAQYKKEISGKNDLKKEIDFMLDGLEAFREYKTVIVRSNHDDFLDRWLRDVDWRKESTMKNSLCYMNYAALLLGEDAPDGVIPYLINEKFPNFITLGRSHTHRIHEWEVGQHGDIGASGSRGSIVQFRKLSTKMIIGHSHSPGRMDGVIQVGTSTILRVGYNIGASPWLQSHSIIHSDGKAQQIHFIRGCFTTLD